MAIIEIPFDYSNGRNLIKIPPIFLLTGKFESDIVLKMVKILRKVLSLKMIRIYGEILSILFYGISYIFLISIILVSGILFYLMLFGK